jgi:hypothetical protein
VTGALDNDVLYKGVCYRLIDELSSFVDASPSNVGILGAARYVVRGLIARGHLRNDTAAALVVLEDFVVKASILEPTKAERDLAAAIELAAQRDGLPLDAGESQLCAIAIARTMQRILTGDKRAIAALDRLLETFSELGALAHKLCCLEQAVLAISATVDVGTLRSRICSEPEIDKALAICFSCFSPTSATPDHIGGLESYIRSLRGDAGRMLAP